VKLDLWMVASAVVILATPTVIGLFDGAAYLVAGDDATISRLSQRVAWAHTQYRWCICFLFGVLCGHLFTTVPVEPLVPRWVSLTLFVAVPYLVVIATVLAGLTAPGALPTTGHAHQFALVACGLVLGAAVGAGLLHQTGD
jgi:uncharacterized membrane protein YbjE (DUF340 family)